MSDMTDGMHTPGSGDGMYTPGPDGMYTVGPDGPAGLGQLGPWFSESFRLTIGRTGYFLPMILIFVLAVSLPSSYAIWYALRDTVITIDQDSGVLDLDYGGSETWLFVASAGFPISIVLSFLLKGAAIRQAMAVKAETPESWSDSVRAVLGRSRRLIGFSALRAAIYWFLIGVITIGAALSPIMVLLIPFLGAGLFFFWVRLSFLGQVATLADDAVNPMAESWRLSGGRFWPLFGRLLLLAALAFNLILASGIIGSPFTAIAGGGGTAPIEPTSDVIRLNDLMGSNPSVFALGSVFNALGLGANYVLAAVGTTLLYRNLGGPVSAAAAVADPSDDGREAE